MSMGHNSVASSEVRAYIARIESCKKRKKEAAEDEKSVFAELKARGFSPRAIRYCVKARELKPNDRQEQELERDLYMHAIGLAEEPPLFRSLQTLAVDTTSRESVKEALKKFVPDSGEIVMKAPGGKPMRLWRDKQGAVQIEDYVEPGLEAPDVKRSTLPPSQQSEIPNCTESEAEQMGKVCREENRPITDNPFPFGDARQDRFEKGWQSAGTGKTDDEDE